ncbi:hypothetical protein [Ramlibacter sp.]|uniref:hypothetical protein n=1 Tax=Ramlibacter sp. TaxID=1917967 RepID=UPI002FC8610B
MTGSKPLAGGLLWLAAAGTAGAAAPPGIAQMDSPTLRRHYLECSRTSEQARLAMPDAQFCSRVAQVLLHRDFGGDLERQWAWWRRAQQEQGGTAVARRRQ